MLFRFFQFCSALKDFVIQPIDNPLHVVAIFKQKIEIFPLSEAVKEKMDYIFHLNDYETGRSQFSIGSRRGFLCKKKENNLLRFCQIPQLLTVRKIPGTDNIFYFKAPDNTCLFRILHFGVEDRMSLEFHNCGIQKPEKLFKIVKIDQILVKNFEAEL